MLFVIGGPAHDPDVPHVIEGEVGIGQIVEAAAAFGGVGVSPARARPERIHQTSRRWRKPWEVPAARSSGRATDPLGLGAARHVELTGQPVGPDAVAQLPGEIVAQQ